MYPVYFERKVLYTKTEFVAYNAYVLSRNSINLDGASLHIFKLTSNISTSCYLHGRKSIFTLGCIIYIYLYVEPVFTRILSSIENGKIFKIVFEDKQRHRQKSTHTFVFD